MPLIRGPGLEGVPAETEFGFVPVDRYGRVDGLDGVYAAGDATNFPVKQGGLAAQQADAVAEHVAARHGARVEPSPFRPVLRGLLFAGGAERYMRAPERGEAAAAARPLWWPPTKIAGRYLRALPLRAGGGQRAGTGAGRLRGSRGARWTLPTRHPWVADRSDGFTWRRQGSATSTAHSSSRSARASASGWARTRRRRPRSSSASTTGGCRPRTSPSWTRSTSTAPRSRTGASRANAIPVRPRCASSTRSSSSTGGSPRTPSSSSSATTCRSSSTRRRWSSAPTAPASTCRSIPSSASGATATASSTAVLAADAPADEGTLAESFIHVEIDRHSGADELERLRERLLDVLAPGVGRRRGLAGDAPPRRRPHRRAARAVAVAGPRRA